MASAAELAAELAKSPGLPPPPGIVPSFVDPYNRADLVTFTTAITFTVATLFILIRAYTKYAINKIGLGWDDCELVLFRCSLKHADIATLDVSILAYVSTLITSHLPSC